MNNFLPEGMLITTEGNRRFVSSPEGLLQAMESGKILEARAVFCDVSHNLIVELAEAAGIIPRSEAAVGIESGATKEVAIISRVGKPVCFKVISADLSCNPPKFILSRRAAQLEAIEYFMNFLRGGDILEGVVTHLEPFGAFVDIGCGFISMISIENISVSRILHPSDRFSLGQKIFAAVLGIDSCLCRVYLTHRELLGTWTENAAFISVGETVPGTVRGIKSYGLFIELTPNLSGLSEPYPGFSKGDCVSVYIKSINPERMKIKLAIISKLSGWAMDKPPIHYFVTGGRLGRWRYSPDGCLKPPIETVFA